MRGDEQTTLHARGGSIRALVETDLPRIVDISLRAWEPVFESLRSQLGDRVSDLLFPDWRTSHAATIETACTDVDNEARRPGT